MDIVTKSRFLPEGVEVEPSRLRGADEILTGPALAFVARLERQFRERRREILGRRIERQIGINSGQRPEFSPDSQSLRSSAWKVAPPPPDLLDRRVEIVVPPERAALASGLESGANVCIADLEDMLSPTWDNILAAHRSLMGAVRRPPARPAREGKRPRRQERAAALMVRPRGWHLAEKHVLVDGHQVSASLLDFGLFLFHNARQLLERGGGPYFSVPKLENHEEARLWNDVFLSAEEALKIPVGSIRAAAPIENILAAFEMHEILHELRDHSAGLVFGMWEYLFSFIKKFRFLHDYILPEQSRVTMSAHFLHACSALMVQTCHKHGVHAIGSLALEAPEGKDSEARREALAAVRARKEREAAEGHDGTQVAHPSLVPEARAAFNAAMPGPNQLESRREDLEVSSADLLSVHKGRISEQGIRSAVATVIGYLEAWLNGKGRIEIDHQFETGSTADISRAQLWQWVHSPNAMLADHRKISIELYEQVLMEEVVRIRAAVGDERFKNGKFHVAVSLLNRLVIGRDFPDFLTLVAYDRLD